MVKFTERCLKDWLHKGFLSLRLVIINNSRKKCLGIVSIKKMIEFIDT